MKKKLFLLLLIPVCCRPYFWRPVSEDDLIKMKKKQIKELEQDINYLKKKKEHPKKQKQHPHMSAQQFGMQLKKDEQGVTITLAPFLGDKVNIAKEKDGFSATFDQGTLNVALDDDQLQLALASQTNVKEETEHSSFAYSVANYQSNHISVGQDVDLEGVAVNIDTQEKKATITIPFEKLTQEVTGQQAEDATMSDK